ncbi:MAG: DUF2069 domain-containing protein [Porticoccaceae bacterium]|nr:DUF2069 domain-containing protein [Porticoccaceae bacterium]
MIKALQTKLKYARYATWGSYFFFIIAMVGGGYRGGTPVSLLLIVSLPLILFLPGMARENDKSLSMLSFVSLLYFIPVVTHVMAPDWDFFDVTSLILICILFTATMMFSRWKKYERAGLGEP